MEGGRERRGEGGGKKQEVGFYLTHRLSSSLYNILRKGFLSKVHAPWFVHTQMLPLLTQTEKRHNEASVLSTPGRHTHTHTKALQSRPDLRMSWLLAKVSEIILHRSQYFM